MKPVPRVSTFFTYGAPLKKDDCENVDTIVKLRYQEAPAV